MSINQRPAYVFVLLSLRIIKNRYLVPETRFLMSLVFGSAYA